MNITVKTGKGEFILNKFGNDYICVNPPSWLNKQSKEYLALKSFLRKNL